VDNLLKEIAIKNEMNTRKISMLFLCIGLIGLIFIPTGFLATLPSVCLHQFLLGFDCPGCGMTSALYAILHLRFSAALNFNFGVYALIPVFALEIYQWLRFSEKLNPVKKLFYYLLYLSLATNYIYKFINFINI
jgi:hypothetical protein